MAEIAPDEMADLELGAYPAIEALAFAVIEMRDWEGWQWEEETNPLPPAEPFDPMHFATGGNIPTRG